MIYFACPNCLEILGAEDNMHGVKVGCYTCKARMLAPAIGQSVAVLLSPKNRELVPAASAMQEQEMKIIQELEKEVDELRQKYDSEHSLAENIIAENIEIKEKYETLKAENEKILDNFRTLARQHRDLNESFALLDDTLTQGHNVKAQPPNDYNNLHTPEIKDVVVQQKLEAQNSHVDSTSLIITIDDIASISPNSPLAMATILPANQQQRTLPPRMRRLVNDADLVQRRLENFKIVQVKELRGSPPEVYIIEYLIRGVEAVRNGSIIYRNSHLTEFKLTSDYPRMSPKCRMLTPIFHPNIEPAVICIGDHWTAQESLLDLIIRVGEIITYQSYNIKSPLDGEAAMWADLNKNMFPVDNRDLTPPE